MKEKILSMLRTVITNEKYKADAFFLCGSNTGMPNEGLQKACEAYLTEAENGALQPGTAQTLVKELETAASQAPDQRGANTVAANTAYLKELLSYRASILDTAAMNER